MILLAIQFEWIYIIYFLGSMIFIYLINRLLVSIRNKTINQLNNLLFKDRNFILYQELLNNKRLRIAFSKLQILMLKLEGYMLEGNDKNIVSLILILDQKKLRGYVKLDFLIKRFTYYIDVLNEKESKKTIDMLEEAIKKSKENADVKEFLNEAKLTYKIYIEKDVTLIPTIINMIKEKTNKKVIGILYYRLAKLYYFNHQNKEMNLALENAQKFLIGTYYIDIIKIAKKDPNILDLK